MSFAEKHPYLFWQLIGWGILLVDFVFTVIAIFNDFGEWSYTPTCSGSSSAGASCSLTLCSR